MNDIAISSNGLGKRYRIGALMRQTSMRERLSRAVMAPSRHLISNSAGAEGKSESLPVAKRSNSPSRILELDGLRGAAVLFVVLFHFIAQGPGGRLGSTLARFQRLFNMGWMGVDLFFVLSGFLIGGILLNARPSPSYFRTFYFRRLFRIIPLYYAWIVAYVLLVAIAGKALGFNQATAPQANLSVARQFFFLQNSMLGRYAGLAIAWFAPTWSLAVEEQFYLVSPLLVRFLSTRVFSIVLFLAILAAPFFRLFVRSHMDGGSYLAYALTLCRMDALAFGMLAAIAWRDAVTREWISSHIGLLNCSLGVMLVGVAGLWKWSSDNLGFVMQTVGFTWIALFFTTLLLVVLAKPAGLIGRAARMGWLRELGKVSYCMYIIHEAVNLFSHFLLLHGAPQILNWQGAMVTVLAGVLTYAIARISWILFENPLLKFGHRFRYQAAVHVDQTIGGIPHVSDQPEIAI